MIHTKTHSFLHLQVTAYVSAFQQFTPVLGLTVKVKITRPLGGETEMRLTDRGFGEPYRDVVILSY